MSQQSDIANAHQAQRIQLAHTLMGRVHRIWTNVVLSDLDGAWDALAPSLVSEVTAAQATAAAAAPRYQAAIDRSYGLEPVDFALAPAAFSGVMLDGREVGPAMYTAVTSTKKAVRGGMSLYSAFQAGANALSVIVGAALHDMGRQADLTIGQAHDYTAYVRVISAGACSRCAILAGKSSAKKAFLRHPSCRCTSCPVQSNEDHGIPSGFFESPEHYFESLSKGEQDKIFTNSGAELIRQGANPASVVNARRGAYGIEHASHYYQPVPAGRRLRKVTIGKKPDGSPLQVFATSEGTTARGSFGRGEIRQTGQATKDGRYRRTTTLRLMPEQIVQMAGGDAARLRDLLQKYGYAY